MAWSLRGAKLSIMIAADKMSNNFSIFQVNLSLENSEIVAYFISGNHSSPQAQCHYKI